MILHSTVLLLLLGSALCQDEYLRRPPSIDQGPAVPTDESDGKVYIYRSEGEITMLCEASGSPEPEYTWFKNLVPYDLNKERITPIPGTGGFTISPASSLDEGYYQCVAQNTYGKAMSDVVFLQRAKNGENPPEQSPNMVEVKNGDPLTIMCTPSLSVPPPTFTWELADSIVDPQPDPFQMTERVQMDPQGNLYFANVLPGDSQGERLYKCNQRNRYLDVTTGGSYTKVKVDLTSGSAAEYRPTTVFVQNQAVGLLGESISLKCLFSGFPTPNMQWKKQGGNLPGGRFDFQEYKTELHIKDLKMEDQGYYECTGSNRVGDKTEIIYLSVEQKPGFPEPLHSNRPVNQNVTEGENAVFICNSEGIPATNVDWYINGDAVDRDNPGPRKSFSDDGRLLTIEKVCKDCPAGGTDLMNVQCNASNVHGYAYADGYLNVLKPTVIVRAPESQELPEWNGKVSFKCEAESDDSTPPAIDWLLNDEDIIYQEGRLEKMFDNTLLVNAENEDDAGESFEGKYTCKAYTRYSEDTADAHLSLPPEEKPIKQGSILDMWWIFLIILIILLLIILICCCYCCITRNKGDAYYVDEKEKAQGLDPIKECHDSGFHDYQRPEESPIKGSRASLSSTIRLDSDDEGSLNEYGDIDTGKFNEDGSFIGTYTDRRNKDSEV